MGQKNHVVDGVEIPYRKEQFWGCLAHCLVSAAPFYEATKSAARLQRSRLVNVILHWPPTKNPSPVMRSFINILWPHVTITIISSCRLYWLSMKRCRGTLWSYTALQTGLSIIYRRQQLKTRSLKATKLTRNRQTKNTQVFERNINHWCQPQKINQWTSCILDTPMDS